MEPIKEVKDVDLAFGGDMKELIPKDIPKEFYKDTKFSKVFITWFYKGLSPDSEFYAKEGVDPGKALRHLKAIMHSYGPKHEEKEAAVTYLLSEWFKDIKLKEPKKDETTK